ncbi:hypothetical protein NF700_07945 [Sphingomonadaceae bacterium OTU29MARTA1]|nr:hypothetical protein NF699_09165 [Sphingomonadaceae bacterium OTU29LAMAA1]USU10175.1 hypothetical protein NF700_07945 [Sphingomonadaceae bacterium OTU29MARTA1]
MAGLLTDMFGGGAESANEIVPVSSLDQAPQTDGDGSGIDGEPAGFDTASFDPAARVAGGEGSDELGIPDAAMPVFIGEPTPGLNEAQFGDDMAM